DPENGNQHLPARTLDTNTGTYLQKDPYPLHNSYQAFNTNPHKYTDPTGNIVRAIRGWSADLKPGKPSNDVNDFLGRNLTKAPTGFEATRGSMVKETEVGNGKTTVTAPELIVFNQDNPVHRKLKRTIWDNAALEILKNKFNIESAVDSFNPKLHPVVEEFKSAFNDLANTAAFKGQGQIAKLQSGDKSRYTPHYFFRTEQDKIDFEKKEGGDVNLILFTDVSIAPRSEWMDLKSVKKAYSESQGNGIKAAIPTAGAIGASATVVTALIGLGVPTLMQG
ncbi:hypothetical protein ACFWBC_38540, partial [Streptomyces sp. NPDC059985]|uniref:hypothetical protein n=1 Tax=Streptomyces sp. NPDC059985 TaxID=3347025 RepID=UPI0036841F05